MGILVLCCNVNVSISQSSLPAYHLTCVNRCFFWTRRRWIGVQTWEYGAEELESADVHALPSAESYPEARGDDLFPKKHYLENLLGTSLTYIPIRPHPFGTIEQDGPTPVTIVCLEHPVTKITRTAIAVRNPEVSDSELER